MSGTFKDKGIVIKEYNTGEWDKNLVLLLADRGKVTVYAKGARNPKSKFHTSSQLFAWSEFVIFEGNGFLSLAQCSLLDTFYYLRLDFERLCCGTHMLELIDKMILPGMLCKNQLKLLFLSLKAMEKSENPRLVLIMFEFKFFQMEGFSPMLDLCSVCKKPAGSQGLFCGAGMVCGSCGRAYPEKASLSEAGLYAVKYILKTEGQKLFAFSLKKEDVDTLMYALSLFRREHLDFEPKSLSLLDG